MGRYRFSLLIIAVLLLACRFFQAQREWKTWESLFPEPAPGVWRAWVAEEPEVLFNHREGLHDTGRLNGVYEPYVKEVRVVCVLVSRDGAPVPPVKARCTLRLNPEDPAPALISYGETVEMTASLLKPPPALNPGQFDYAHYLKTKGVPYVMYVPSRRWHGIEGVPRAGGFFMEVSCRLRRWAQERIYHLLPFPQNALLDGILLGERGALPGDMVEAFMETGTVHILAVSGMITAFLAGILFMLFRASQFPRKAAAWVTLAGVLFFIALTGAHPPVCRAGLFAILALLAVLLERRVHGGALLAATAYALTVANPFVVEDLSFQISFLATAGLMVMGRRFEDKLKFLWKPAAGLLAATAAAQISVWVLLIYSFNQLSLYSLLANLLIVPLALFSVAAGLAALAASCLSPFLGSLFAAGSDVVLRLLILLAQWINRWPGANFIAASPPAIWVLFFHALLLITFTIAWPRVKPELPSEEWRLRQAPIRWGRKALPWAWILFAGITFMAWCVEKIEPKGFRIVFFSVGHADAAILETPSGKTLALDGGWFNQGLPRYQTTAAYLRHRGFRRLTGILNLSATDEDAGGLANLIAALPVSDAYGLPGDYPESWGCQAFLDALEDQGLPFKNLRKGDSIPGLDGAVLKVLSSPPRKTDFKTKDTNHSMALLVTLPGSDRPVQILFAGNCGKEQIGEIKKDFTGLLRLDWLVTPRHGALSAGQDEWAETLRPSHVLVSDSKNHPEDEVFYRSANPSSVILGLASTGSVEVEVGPGKQRRFRTFREGIWRAF